MSEGEPKKPNLEGDKGDKIPNRLAYPGPMGTALNLLALSVLANMPESNLDNLLRQYTNPDRKILETLDGLDRGLDDVYIFLFEHDSTTLGMDDLIAEAGKLRGNKMGLHWHVEVVYYRDEKWMAMGCRPTGCTRDKPLTELQQERGMRGYTVNIQHVKLKTSRDGKIPQRDDAIALFDRDFNGKSYSLAGPEKRNCTDAAFGLAKAAGLADEKIIRSVSLEELKGSADIETFKENYLKKLGYKDVEDIMQRDTIILPDEFAKIGKYVRSVKFGNMQF